MHGVCSRVGMACNLLLQLGSGRVFQLDYYNDRQFLEKHKTKSIKKFNKDSRTANFLQNLSIRIVHDKISRFQ
jgi:hypothetical protein